MARRDAAKGSPSLAVTASWDSQLGLQQEPVQCCTTLGCPGTGESSPALQANMQHQSSISAVQDLFLSTCSHLFCNDNKSTSVRGQSCLARVTISHWAHATLSSPPSDSQELEAVPIPLFLALLRHHRPAGDVRRVQPLVLALDEMDGVDNLVRRGQTDRQTDRQTLRGWAQSLGFNMFPIDLCLDLLTAQYLGNIAGCSERVLPPVAVTILPTRPLFSWPRPKCGPIILDLRLPCIAAVAMHAAQLATSKERQV
ncbi:hypothetical protein TRIATDRAFT_92093 [Trichoderma atroviride IMI 206040]|uniref:Uncharacterized protein n=1 Tax=Hypocrea atroviridis (strain ATCC 20476 / IMI 206040) TaxID=452589 RepID=G9NJ87_HYPAI|nr:uncharacterized protein TRIATDRAFT_92093 [Trichoderma atroviride IMI 206040]EHK48962.1 hypothetical protein TRIATDRAFT_92093 [Trichoderma atroviride IMI 206040]